MFKVDDVKTIFNQPSHFMDYFKVFAIKTVKKTDPIPNKPGKLLATVIFHIQNERTEKITFLVKHRQSNCKLSIPDEDRVCRKLNPRLQKGVVITT